jgi:hypothetical protein
LKGFTHSTRGNGITKQKQLNQHESTGINMNQHESVAAPQRLKEGQQTLRRLEIDALMVIQLAFYGTLNGTLMGFKWGFHGSLIYFNGISLGFISWDL